MNKQARSRAICQDLIVLMLHSKRYLYAACESWQLTPAQGFLLISLKPGILRTMNQLAESMYCDPSNITGLIDRLEANNYIERTADKKDRRIKQIQLTPKGVECQAALLDEFCRNGSLDLDKLSNEEIKVLRSVTSKLT